MNEVNLELLKSFLNEDLINELKERDADVNLTVKDFGRDELRKELERWGYYVSDNEPELSDWSDPDIAEYLVQQGYKVDTSDGNLPAYISDLPAYKLRDFLCDVVGVNHHTSKEKVLELLTEKM